MLNVLHAKWLTHLSTSDVAFHVSLTENVVQQASRFFFVFVAVNVIVVANHLYVPQGTCKSLMQNSCMYWLYLEMLPKMVWIAIDIQFHYVTHTLLSSYPATQLYIMVIFRNVTTKNSMDDNWQLMKPMAKSEGNEDWPRTQQNANTTTHMTRAIHN